MVGRAKILLIAASTGHGESLLYGEVGELTTDSEIQQFHHQFKYL